MKILHTSDWHLGRALYGRKRFAEFEAFLDWLAESLQQYEVDALLVAGDIFDTTTPGNRTQALYYRFLCRVAASGCRHVIIVAGNHDSPSFLNAPRELLRALDVHVVGAVTDEPANELLLLCDRAGAPELIVCAVPYLRDRDIRVAEAGESSEEKGLKLIEGIRDHYARVAALALQMRSVHGSEIPIVGMGHLFAAGGQVIDDDGVRELYVGSLAHVNARIFPDSFDYLALGHLHVPQKVGGSEVMRYSGSPLPMGFGEAGQQKSVCLIDLCSSGPRVRLLDIPCFQALKRIRGDWERISADIGELSVTGSNAWLEIIYEGDEVIGDLRDRLEMAVAGSGLEILRVKNSRIVAQVMKRSRTGESLDDLSVSEVFERCLVLNDVPEAQRQELLHAYRETLTSLDEDDRRAQ